MISVDVILIGFLVCSIVFIILNVILSIDEEYVAYISAFLEVLTCISIFSVIEENHRDISFGVKFMNSLVYSILFSCVYLGLIWTTYRYKIKYRR